MLQKFFIDGPNIIIPIKFELVGRKAKHSFPPRHVTFELQQEICKFCHICVS